MKLILVLSLALVVSTAVLAKPNKEVAKEKPVEESIEEGDPTLNDDIHPEEITKTHTDEDIKSKSLPKGLKIAEIEEEYTPEAVPEARVSYDGSQLLRVVLDSKDKKKIIGKLRDTRGRIGKQFFLDANNNSPYFIIIDISMWGGNQTAVDILVRPDSKDTVLKSLASNTINYEVVIEDVQKAIDEENPVQEDDELENRQGKCQMHLIKFNLY